MKKFKTKVLILQDGKLIIDAPVRRGDNVEVSLTVLEPEPPTYPLRGLPIRYEDPFLPAVPPDDWDSEK